MPPTGAVTADLLRRAWSALGGDPIAPQRLTVTGDAAGLLPSPLPALPAMVAAVSAATLAAAELDAARRGGRPRAVTVAAEHVAVAARSERHASVAGTPAAAGFAPLSRFWRTADGWLRLHANYPWHRDRALRVLGCADEPSAVAKAVHGWRGADLEDALAAAGAVGYAVRDPAAWRRHPQGRAVSAGTLVDSDTTGTATDRPLGRGAVADGVRVLDLTRVIAGPVATRVLAGWGADVLRLDSPALPEIPAQTVDTLPGKRSAYLDFADPAGRARLAELLDAADVLVQGYRPGALARYGLDAPTLAGTHPHLSVVTLSAWGPTGPWADRRGFDSVVQAPTGIAALAGDGDAPGALPAQILDHATGYLAAAAALLALTGTVAGGPPRSVRLSLARTARWLVDAGPTGADGGREVAPDPYLVTLAGADAPVRVVGPPGRLADRRPHWAATTRFGADPPRFRTPDAGAPA